MPDFETIYATQAREYDLLVAREDYRHNLLPALNAIRPLSGLDVIEFGAGTGRITRLLLPLVRSVLACDASPHMLSVASSHLRQSGRTNWQVAVAEHAHIPTSSHSASLTIGGWTFGHAPRWHPEDWRTVISRYVSEMKRLLRPGSAAIIVETLGTGEVTPRPPTENLAAYYRFIEQEHGFNPTWIRTDYRFQSTAEASTLPAFFFGEEMAGRVDPQTLILPECTGIWWLTVP